MKTIVIASRLAFVFESTTFILHHSVSKNIRKASEKWSVIFCLSLSLPSCAKCPIVHGTRSLIEMRKVKRMTTQSRNIFQGVEIPEFEFIKPLTTIPARMDVRLDIRTCSSKRQIAM